MNLSCVIIAPIVTEKAERLKASDVRTYTLRVDPRATKVDVINSLKMFYGVDVSAVRIIKTQAKKRDLGAGKTMEKRHACKKAMVTLKPKSKALDISDFQVISA
ncbi:50S ribosomal protein L23 [Candidatus Peregrinibacteria bacterium]|nr:50S ribosomal protein L23 [Candidatus Peregrinibacteria bacterium]